MTSAPQHVGGVLVLYHRPIAPLFRDASTIGEHVSSFGRYSRLGRGQPERARGDAGGATALTFDAVILHYSLFAAYRLDDDFRGTSGHRRVQGRLLPGRLHRCQKRFAFLDEHGIDCVYTSLEPQHFDAVYGRYTTVPKVRHTSPDTSATSCVPTRSGSASPTRSARSTSGTGRGRSRPTSAAAPRRRSDRAAVPQSSPPGRDCGSTSRAPRPTGCTATLAALDRRTAAPCSGSSPARRRSTSRTR